MKSIRFLLTAAAAAASTAALAGEMDRPTGFKVGDRLTLRPYVSMSYTYDSNVDSTRHGKTGSNWSVEPGIAADYLGENWKLDGRAWYQYHAYNHYSSQLNTSSFGEILNFTWADSLPNEKGWTVKFSEQFRQIAQDDDMTTSDGRGMGRDRKEFTFDSIVERRINQYLHGALTAGYYYLDYENNVKKYATMFGWERVTVGGEAGYTASKWTDFVISGNYMWYTQDNDSLHGSPYYSGYTPKGRHISGDSEGWSLMGGIATRATERIEYRLLGGYSRFDYGNGAKKLGGFTYQTSARWAINDRLSFMLLGSSYYQPSENSYGSANKVYTASAGLAKSWVRGKLSTNIDLAYRKERTEYAEYNVDNYDRDIYTGRIALNYRLNRFLTAFTSLEYQMEDSDRRSYEYDRWRGTVGMRLTY